MSNELATTNGKNEIIQNLVLSGDLSKMNPQQKVDYYKHFCESLGLNMLTQPFQIINFQGKQKLYATKDCTEQLRKIYGVSITEISTTVLNNDVFVVTAKAQDKTGKTDCSTGVVTIRGLSGEALANALMKGETKAKRRVTLSICGLGILDESETDTMPGAEMLPVPTVDATITTAPTFIQQQTIDAVGDKNRSDLLQLLETSTYEGDVKVKLAVKIETMTDYADYLKAKDNLEVNQMPEAALTADVDSHVAELQNT